MTYTTSVFKRDGSLWTEYELADYGDVTRRADDWLRQPGTLLVHVRITGTQSTVRAEYGPALVALGRTTSSGHYVVTFVGGERGAR